MLESCPKVEIIACEPSPFWSKYLAEQFKKSENVKINNTLLWDSANEMYFDDDLQNGGLDAQILKSPKEGSTKIPTDTIDNLSQGKKLTIFSWMSRVLSKKSYKVRARRFPNLFQRWVFASTTLLMTT